MSIPSGSRSSALPSRRRFIVRVAALVGAPAVLGVLQACAPSAPATAPAPAGATAKPAAPAPAAATAAPAAKPAAAFKTPIITQGVDPETLDPHFGESGISANIFQNAFDTLVHYDRKLNIVPVLAESWQVMEDKLTWRFKLRQNVKFQNGEPFNAEAVKFTLERTMNDDLRKKGLNDPFPSRSGITKVNVIDQSTVDLVLKAPNIVLPVFLTFMYMLEPKYYSSKSPQETALAPIGTGPWQVTEWIKGDRLTMKAFSGYWRGAPPIPEIVFKPVPEKATRLNMLLAGEADVVGGLTPEDFPTVEGNAKLRVSRASGSRRVHMGIPTNVPKYKSRAVRQALVQAIDYDGIAKGLLGPMAPTRRSNVLVTGETWLNPELKPVAYDPEAAKKALQAAGFPMGDKISIISPSGRYLKDKELAQALAGSLRTAGLTAEAQILDWTVYSDKMRAEKGGLDDLYLLGLGSRFNGPEDASILTTGQIWDQTRWIDQTENGPKFQAIYKELLQTFDEKKQKEMVNQMQALFQEEAVWASLWLEPAASGVNKRLTWEDSGGGNSLRFWIPNEEPSKITA